MRSEVSAQQYAEGAKQAAIRVSENIQKYLELHDTVAGSRNMMLHVEEAVHAAEEIELAAKEAAEKLKRYSALRTEQKKRLENS
jgi:hypothetical protein